MARKPRFNLVGVPQHVIQRGNNREPYFFSEEDYAAYLVFGKNRVREQLFLILEYITL